MSQLYVVAYTANHIDVQSAEYVSAYKTDESDLRWSVICPSLKSQQKIRYEV